MSKKICCHCGVYTHSQPQDPNHDLGYGHCYKCLGNASCYVGSSYQLAKDLSLSMWEMRPTKWGDLFDDDSNPKVIEIIADGKVLVHQTLHCKKGEILDFYSKKYQEQKKSERCLA